MADTNSKQLFRFRDTGKIQGRLDLPFYHDPGQPVVVQKGLRVLPQPWAYNHTNVITDTCWCHRACKQYFAIFAQLKQINIVSTTIIIEDSKTKDEVSVVQNLYPIDGLKKGSVVSKGKALFKSQHGGVSLRGVSPVDGTIKQIKTQDTGQSYWSYVPQCQDYYHIGDGNNDGMVAQWDKPKTVKITPMVQSGDYSTIQGVHPPAYIRTVGPTQISLDSSFLVYPESEDYIPKYKMRVATNYQPPRDTSKNGCPSQTIQLGLKTQDIKRQLTKADLDQDSKIKYRQVTLKRIPGDKTQFAFNKQYQAFAKFWQDIGYVLPHSIQKIPYKAFVNAKYAIPQPPPGYVITAGDSTLGVASQQWNYWSFVSNQQLGYGLASFIYYGYKRLSDNPLTGFPQSDKEWTAADGFNSDFFRSTSPISYKLKNDNYVIDYNNKPSQMPPSSLYPVTDYTNIVQDFARHSTMQQPGAGTAPQTCPQSFMKYEQQPSTGSFSWGIYRSVYTKSISQMDALVTYTPDAWQLISQNLSQTTVIQDYLKAGKLGCIITGDDIQNLTIVATAAIAYDVKQKKYLASPPNLDLFQYWKGIRITYAYPYADCSDFAVDSGVGTNWMWKRGGLDPQYYNKWMLLGADQNYCTTTGFTQAPAILKHCLPVDSSGSTYVYCLPPATWYPGLQQQRVPDTTSDMKVKKHYLEVFPKLTASVTGYGNQPQKLDTSNSSFSLGDKDPDTGAQLSRQVIQGVEYYYKQFSACSDYKYTKQNMTQSISCNIVQGVAINSNQIAGDILTQGLQLDKVCSQLDPNNCTQIKANNLIKLDGTRLQKDQTKKIPGIFNLDGRTVIVSCYKSVINLAKSKLDKIYNKLYQQYLKQANNLKYPQTPCPNCQQNKQVKVVLQVYQENGAWTYKTIQSLPDKRDSIQQCTNDPNGQFTIQRVAQQVQWTLAYVIVDQNSKQTTDKDDVIQYTYYKRCMANTVVQTTSDCQQNQPNNYMDDCKYYVTLRGKCGATLGTTRLDQAVKFFTATHKPKYPSKPKPQYPCGTQCEQPTQKTWYQYTIQSGYDMASNVYSTIQRLQQQLKGQNLYEVQQGWIPPAVKQPQYYQCQGYQVTVESDIVVDYLIRASKSTETDCNIYSAEISLYATTTSAASAAQIMKSKDLVAAVKNLIVGIKSSGACSWITQTDCGQQPKACYFKQIRGGITIAHIQSIPTRAQKGWGLNGLDGKSWCALYSSGDFQKVCLECVSNYWIKVDMYPQVFQNATGKYTFYGTGYILASCSKFTDIDYVNIISWDISSRATNSTSLHDRAVYIKYEPAVQVDCSNYTDINSLAGGDVNAGTAINNYVNRLQTLLMQKRDLQEATSFEAPAGFPSCVSTSQIAQQYSAAVANLNIGD